MNWIRERINRFIVDTVLQEIVTWGHCGLCGSVVKNELFWRYWNWGICQECLDEYEGHEEDIDMSKTNYDVLMKLYGVPHERKG